MGRVKHLESEEDSSEESLNVSKRRRKESGKFASSTSAAAKVNVEQSLPASSAVSGFAANVQASSSSGDHLIPGMAAGSGINAFVPGIAASIAHDRALLASMPTSKPMSLPASLAGVGMAGNSAGPHVNQGGSFSLGASLIAEPAVATTRMDFSKDLKDVGVARSTIDVPKQLVSILMTKEHQQLFVEESGAKIEWVPAERKALVSGSAEQVKQASRLFNRVNIHCLWGISAEKVRQLLRPRKVESVQCRLSPMGNLPAGRKTLTPRDRTMSVGKGADNDVICPGSGIVSRLHFLLELDEDRGAVYIHDCSTNGTYLNGVRLPAQQSGKVFLSHGDEILLREQQTSGLNEFGYIVNLKNISVKAEAKLEAPRRLLSPEEMRTAPSRD